MNKLTRNTYDADESRRSHIPWLLGLIQREEINTIAAGAELIPRQLRHRVSAGGSLENFDKYQARLVQPFSALDRSEGRFSGDNAGRPNPRHNELLQHVRATGIPLLAASACADVSSVVAICFKRNIIPLRPHALFCISQPFSGFRSISTYILQAFVHPKPTGSVPFRHRFIRVHKIRGNHCLEAMFVEPANEVLDEAPPVPLRRHGSRPLLRLRIVANAAAEVIKPPLRHIRHVEGGRGHILLLLVCRPQTKPCTELEPHHQQKQRKVLENLSGRFWGPPFRLQLAVSERLISYSNKGGNMRTMDPVRRVRRCLPRRSASRQSVYAASTVGLNRAIYRNLVVSSYPLSAMDEGGRLLLPQGVREFGYRAL
jgi:hypothetical protein